MTIGTWKLEQSTVSLSLEGVNQLAYSIDEKKTTFEPPHYSIEQAALYAKLFSRTIGTNLAKGSIRSSCFLPQLSVCVRPRDLIPLQDGSRQYASEIETSSTTATNIPEFQVALFGIKDKTFKMVGMRWAIVNLSTQEETTLEVSQDALAIEFLHHSSPDPDRQKRYAQPFRVVMMCNSAYQVTSIFLKRFSQIDRNVPISYGMGAITFVSATRSTGCTPSQIPLCGHAMLAVEWISCPSDNDTFCAQGDQAVHRQDAHLLYIHFTDDGRIKKEPGPYHTINGPTWSRSTPLIQCLLDYVNNQQDTVFPFALSGGIVPIVKAIPGLLYQALKHEITGTQTALADATSTLPDPAHMTQNCIGCAERIALYAGIIFRNLSTFTTPLQRIAELNESPAYEGQNLSPLQFQILLQAAHGRPDLPELIKKDGKKFKDAKVVLVPNDCDQERLLMWINACSSYRASLKDDNNSGDTTTNPVSNRTSSCVIA